MRGSLRITPSKPSETVYDIIQLPKLQYKTFVRGRFNLRRSKAHIEYRWKYVCVCKIGYCLDVRKGRRLLRL